MKIGIVTTWFERGAAYVSRQFADVLREAGHEVFVYARGGEAYAKGDPNWDYDWVDWGKYNLFQHDSKVDKRDFKNWLSTRKIERVIFNEQRHWDAVRICQDAQIPTALYVDYYKEDEVDGFLNYDALICNTRRHYSVFSWHSGAYYLPWGTDCELYKPVQLNRISDECVVFFHSAGMSPFRKGTDFVLQAFKQLEECSAKLIIHTQVSLTKELPEMEQAIATLVDSGRLEIIEKTVGAPGLYHLGDVYVYPSRLEGIGLTICEAQACGLPVIVPDNGPMNEFVEKGCGGRTAKVKSFISRSDGYYWPMCISEVDSLAENMKYYVENAEAIPTLKQEARRYAEERRNWKKNASKLGSIISSFIPAERATVKRAQGLVKNRKLYQTIFSVFNSRSLRKLRSLIPRSWAS